jgi:uncharacterized protein (TIGR02246 family)
MWLVSPPCYHAAFVLLLAQVTGLCLLQAQTAQSDSAAIHELGRQFSAAYRKGDAGAMTDLYTADAVILPERSDPITGREGIMRYWSPKPGRRVTRHGLTPTSIVVDGDHGYDHGTYEIVGEREGKAWGPYREKYVVVWQRQGGAWRIQLDIWNSGPSPGS